MNDLSQISWIEPTEATISGKPINYFDNLLQLLHTDDKVAGWPDVFGDALHDWVTNTSRTPLPLKILSLFSGGGGLDIAFRDAGLHAVQMIELDPRYVETLRLNSHEGKRFEDTQPLCMDIKDFQPSDNSRVDFIIGGPPCQTFSAAGRRAAGVSGLDDPRGKLFHEYIRILRELQPKGFLFENVYGITGAQGGKAWQEILCTFESIGYKISYRILDVADYGVPQHRERLIIVGMHEKTFAFPRPTHGPDTIDQRLYYTPGLAIQNVCDEKPRIVGGRYGPLLKDIPPGLNYSFYTEEMGHPTPHFAWRSKFSDFLYKADPYMPARTIKAQGGQYTGPFHWENRHFSIGELKRLQTFPDNYVLAGGQLAVIQQLGNSVPPQFGRILAIAVLDQVFGIQFPFKIDYLLPYESLGFRQRKTYFTAIYREKAKEAIATLYHSNVHDVEKISYSFSDETMASKTSEHRSTISYTAYLSPNFLWRIKDESNTELPENVKCSVISSNESIIFYIGDDAHTIKTAAIEIEVSHVGKWKVLAPKVYLIVQDPSLFMLTAAWKAFDDYLARQAIKADIVQLNGYYTYKPKIKIKVSRFESPDSKTRFLWQALTHVLEGRGVRQIFSVANVSTRWMLSIQETIDALVQLKTLGYEVRSEYTNSQIPKGHVLIPYAFPTLNQNSVQLRKTLFPALSIGQEKGFSQGDTVKNKGLWSL